MTRTMMVAMTLVLAAATSATAQSLHLPAGTNGLQLGAGWSVGPSSNGVETFVGGSIGGTVDVGVQISRYTLKFDDGFESTFENYAPLVSWFPVKQQSGAPISLSVNGQLFVDQYDADEDSGKYVQIGTTIYKAFELGHRWTVTPFGGFAFVAESYAFGGAPAENAQYLTRDFGLHFTSPADRAWMIRFTVLDQSFRRETYRAARAAVIRRF
jgi:hypothetical protein